MKNDSDFLFPKNIAPVDWNIQDSIDDRPVSEIVCMVCDNGVFGPELCIRLAREFKKVYFYSAWKEEFPVLNQLCISFGVPGIINVRDVFEPDDVDLYVFPNVGDPYIQKQLISQGKKVFGSRMAEDLELNRFYGAKQLQKVGLPVPNIINVKGIDYLIKYLTPLEDKWIKISYYRGEMETFHFTNIKECYGFLENLKHKLGAIGNEIEFLVYDPIEAIVETGGDLIIIDGKPSSHMQIGYELKDEAYIAKIVPYNDCPEIIKTVHDKINPLLGQYGYRNLFSTEIRVTNSKLMYMSDFTCRFGAPSFELFIENCQNFPEVIWKGAQGISIPLEMKYTYGVSAHIYCEFAQENWAPIFFPKEIRPFVKIRNLAIINDIMYYVPQPYEYPEYGCVLGFGNTLEEAVNHCKQNASQISGYQITIKLDSIEAGLKQIEEGNKIGISF